MPPSDTPSRRIPRGAAAIGWFGVAPPVWILQSTPAWLATPELVAAAAALLVVVSGLVGWRLQDRRDDRRPHSGLTDSDATIASLSDQSPDRPQRTPSDSGVLMPSSAGAETITERAFFAGDDTVGNRVCPQCERQFPAVFDTCPFDATRLLSAPGEAETQEDFPHLPRRYCPSCDRRYELTALYCYHDGHELLRDHSAAADKAQTLHICRSCGWESMDDEHLCPRDDQELVCLDPADHSRIAPAFPFNRCRRCGYAGAPGETRCPTDGSMLLPELNIRLTALPPLGHGPRRRVCPTCGTEYGDHCQFCSYDGEELVGLN